MIEKKRKKIEREKNIRKISKGKMSIFFPYSPFTY